MGRAAFSEVTRSARRRTYRLGVDVGGTFTDLVLTGRRSGRLHTLKVPTQPHDLASGVSKGIAALIEREGLKGSDVTSFVHGTTLATNTIIEQSGATVGLIVTRGTRDVLELGRLRLGDPTNFYSDRATPLVPRRLVCEVGGRLLASGEEREPFDETEAVSAALELVRAGATAIAICFLHSYVNNAHEQRAAAAIRRSVSVYVCASSDVWPQQREYERAVVTVMNAMLGSRISEYLGNLKSGLAPGMAKEFLCTKSNGGVTSAAEAGNYPVQLLLSGPAAGVVGALHLGSTANAGPLLTLDIGGTSADVAAIVGRIPYTSEGRVGDYPVLLPTVDVLSIGAGGGSIAWTDASGLLKVGPRSAGSDPGPAAYARGGSNATVTDAYLAIGAIAADRFLGGTMPLDLASSMRALSRLGEKLDLGEVETASAILQVATAAMQARILPYLAARGVAPQELTLFAFGGAGPTHGFLLARELGMTRVMIPPSPGTLCALGCLVADLRADFIQSVALRCSQDSWQLIESIIGKLTNRGRSWIKAQSTDDLRGVTTLVSADMRYVGQSFDLSVNVPQKGGAAALKESFERVYEGAYQHRNAGGEAEIVNIRVQFVGVLWKARTFQLSRSTPTEPRQSLRRRVYIDGRWHLARVIDRRALGVGDTFRGPAIVEQYDTTVLVPSEFRVTVDEQLNLVGVATGR